MIAEATKTSKANGAKGWRARSVKARHFIIALKDYYVEKSIYDSSFLASDCWAIKYVDIRYARCILEAFDTDASGFVTINGVNNFTRLKPSDWRYVLSPSARASHVDPRCSLPHWIAYWAIGDLLGTLEAGGLTFFQVGRWLARRIAWRSRKSSMP